MAEFYNVVFAGGIAQGADPVAVRANIGRLFKASDAMLDKLFSGQRTVVKKAVDQATAMKYRAVMKQAGAIAVLEEADAQGQPLTAAVEAPKATMAQRVAALAAEHAKQPQKPTGPVIPPPADVQRVDTWKLFPPGSLLSEIKKPVAAPLLPDIRNISLANPGSELLKPEERATLAPPPAIVPDISAIKLAPSGADLVKPEDRPVVAPVVVDISALSMAAPNTDVLKDSEKRVVVPVVVDVSALSVAQVGVDLGQIKEEKKAVNPDISHLKMAGG